MPYLNEIVCLINNSFTSFEKGERHGIAYQATKKTDSGEQLFPVYLLNNEPKYIGIDDSKSSILYHRIVRTTYARDRLNDTRYTASVQMLLVVYGKNMDMRAENVEALLLSQFPDSYQNAALTGYTGLNSVRVQFTSTDMNPVSVFGGEYRNVPYRIAPEDVYFSVSYTIEMQFDKACVDICEVIDHPDSLCDFIEISTAAKILECMSDAQEEAMQELICGTTSCDYDVYIDGVFSQSVTLTNCEDLTINIV